MYLERGSSKLSFIIQPIDSKKKAIYIFMSSCFTYIFIIYIYVYEQQFVFHLFPAAMIVVLVLLE